MLRILSHKSGPEYSCNSYFYGEEGGNAVLFDPGGDGNSLLSFLKRHYGRLCAIFLTHGHYDHWAGIAPFLDLSPIYIGEGDVSVAEKPSHNLSFSLFGERESLSSDRLTPIVGRERFEFPGLGLIEAFPTPSHTPGSFSFYLPDAKAVISGDALFHLSVGRTDLPLGDEASLPSTMDSFLSLPMDTKLFPGHGPSSFLTEERLYNPYLAGRLKKRL